jgi:hypothetical protein
MIHTVITDITDTLLPHALLTSTTGDNRGIAVAAVKERGKWLRPRTGLSRVDFPCPVAYVPL